MTMTSQFAEMTSSSIFFELALFFLWSLVTGLSFMSISLLVQELWKFSFIGDWSEIGKSKILAPLICQISGDWDKIGIINLARMYLMKIYWMLQNDRVTAFALSQLLKENQQGVKLPHSPFQIRVKSRWVFVH